jgi:hypothetical protein
VARKKAKGFGEAQAPFGSGTDELNAVFAAYGFACAFTGIDLTAEAAADPEGVLLNLTRLQPRPNERIPACLEAIFAYERGHMAIGPAFNLLVDLSRIDPEFLARLNPGGRLTLPRIEALYPPSALLKAHRDEFAERLID